MSPFTKGTDLTLREFPLLDQHLTPPGVVGGDDTQALIARQASALTHRHASRSHDSVPLSGISNAQERTELSRAGVLRIGAGLMLQGGTDRAPVPAEQDFDG